MKLLDLIEKFVDQTPEVGGEKAVPRPFPTKPIRMGDAEHDRNREDLIAYMQGRGWFFTGSGHFATVFESDKVPGMVLKLMPERDRGYMRFYSMAKRSDNPHFPHVSRMGVMNVPEPMYAVLVEKLEYKDYAMVAGFVDAVMDFMYYGEAKPLPEFITEKYPEFKEALWMVLDLVGKPKSKYSDDIHNANILWRGNVPVITDPLVVMSEIR